MEERRDKFSRGKCDVDLSFLPIKLQKKLMPFQKEGVKFAIRKNGRCLIADEMGLGKTLQALCVSYYYRAEWPLLIVVPSSLRYPWIEELERWLPEIDPHSINLIQSGGDVSDISRAAVTIVTYGLLRHPASRLVQEALLNQHFEMVIVDESHYIKNRMAVGTKFLVPLLQRATHKLLLTGTPALARPEELFPQLDSLCPGDFGSWTDFSRRYCDAKWQYFGRHRRKWSTVGASNLEELQMMMTGKVMIRRLKKNVLTQLPPKQRQRIAFELKDSQLKKELDSTWEDLQVALGKKRMTVAGFLSARDAQQQEQPSSTEIYRLLGEIRKRTCTAKIGPVKDYIKMLCENAGLKLIVFAHFHVMMDSLTDLLHDLTIKFIRIDGNTPQQDRPRLVHQFQTDSSTRVAILSIRAAGVGLTLTAATLVVFAELDWTPGTLEQCEDRAHRIGQHDTVHVHYLVAKGTLDDWVWSALARKTTVVTTALNGEMEVLRMDDADAAQLHCLTNADPFLPTEKSDADIDIASFFQVSQTPHGQKSVLDYFTSSRKRKMDNTSNVTKSHGSDSVKKSRKTVMGKFRNSHSCPDIVLIVSDDDEHSDFKPSTVNLRMPKSDMTEDDVGNFHLWSSEENDNVDEKRQMASNVRNEQAWSCRFCTFCNHHEIPVCEMCNSPKVKKNTPVKPAVGSSKKPQRCRVMLGMLSPGVGDTPEEKQKMDRQRGDSGDGGDSDIVNDDVLGKLPTVMSLPLVPSTNRKFSNTISAEDCDSVESSHQKESVGCPLSQPDSLPMTSLSESDDDVSEDVFDACCRHLTDDRQKLNDGDKLKYIAQGTVGSADTHSQKENRNRLNGKECYQFKVHEMSDSSDDSPDVHLESLNDRALGKNKSRLSNITGCKKSYLDAGKEHEMSDLSDSSDICQQDTDTDTETVAVNPALADGDICKDTQESQLRTGENVRSSDSGAREEDHGGSGADEKLPQTADTRVVNIDSIVTHTAFHYLCSKNTSRIFLYDHTKEPLNVNFVPLDVEMSNYGELPDLLLQPTNLRLVCRFLRQWNSLAPNKRRLIVKSGEIFLNPCLLYEELKSGRVASKQRYTTKLDVAAVTLSKADEIGGSVRVISRNKTVISNGKMKHQSRGQVKSIEDRTKASWPEQGDVLAALMKAAGKKETESSTDRVIDSMKGILQAVDAEGRPLCVNCQQPYQNELVGFHVMQENPWQTRFCCRDCMQQYWMRTNRGYSVQQVFESEHGICQLCQVDAHEFFLRVKNCTSLEKRAQLIQESCYKVLKKDVKDKMVRQPQKGLFWNVDHMTPVAEGGGECDVDNLRTLCSVCHRGVTAEQSKERAKQKQRQLAAKCGDITAFFHVQ